MAETAVHVYHYVPEHPLFRLSADDWLKFCGGNTPIEEALPAPQIRLLALTLRDGVCESIEPFLIDVDANGYLVKKDIALAPLDALDPCVVDLRALFISRYVRHAHQWHPATWVLSEAFERSLTSVNSRASSLDSPSSTLT